jgi:flavin-binding protein dodecin
VVSTGLVHPPTVGQNRAISAAGPPSSGHVEEENTMNRTYRVTEIVGTSNEGVDEAVRNGIGRAAQTLRHLDWFEVTEIRGQIVDGEVQHVQVGMKVGFRLEDA